MKIQEIQETADVWVAWSNTDCTEGRGRQFPLFVCESEACARRLGRKGSVQGSDCSVTKELAVKIGNIWLVPGSIEKNTKEDAKVQEMRDKRDALEARMKDAGFTEEELALLKVRVTK